MKKYNVIVVFSHDEQKVLMCLRRKNPFQGMYNLVGGKRKGNETSEQAAYRELYEETHISSKDISLAHTHDLNYYLEDMILEVWAGQLKENIDVYGEENEIKWISLQENFFDVQRFAGYGNIGHILYSLDLHKEGWKESSI